jgi:hypothetical protein
VSVAAAGVRLPGSVGVAPSSTEGNKERATFGAEHDGRDACLSPRKVRVL